MGMAASQARYLALVARKSNCEYEGQQINQARTALSNQSANLFNQMLGLKVPVPPSTSDFTKTVYTYKDGLGKETKLDNWQQLATSDENYNYVVTKSYDINRYTGATKKMSDPQVQFPTNMDEIQLMALRNEIKNREDDIKVKKADYEAKAKTLEEKEKAYADALDAYNTWVKDNRPTDLSACAQQINVTKIKKNDDNSYTLSGTAGEKTLTNATYIGYDKLTADAKREADQTINDMVELGLLDTKALTDKSNLYFYQDGKTLITKTDLDAVLAKANADTGELTTPSELNYYRDDIIRSDGKISAYLDSTKKTELETDINEAEAELNSAKAAADIAKTLYEQAVKNYSDPDLVSHPEYVGNCALNPLGELSEDQIAEIKQVIADMQEQGIDVSITDCFGKNADGSVNYNDYLGGIYSFKLNGIVYYTTFDDLAQSYTSGTGANHIDGQTKLSYYNATYVNTTIEETQKALVETDGQGRFASIRFEDDSIVYTLNMATETDDAAYQDAMNQYYYDNAVYDKMIRDINAKTSIIQQEDQQLELRLKQLDTEQNALSTEMEAVQKVVKDNVEKSFKTFGG